MPRLSGGLQGGKMPTINVKVDIKKGKSVKAVIMHIVGLANNNYYGSNPFKCDSESSFDSDAFEKELTACLKACEEEK